MNKDLETRLVSCFAAVFPELESQTLPALTAADVAEWDSLATVNLAGVIEDEFDIDVGPEEAQKFVSFASIADFLATQDA